MNHLPQPMALGYNVPLLPLLCDPNDYDNQGFHDFPRRRGALIVADQFGNRTIVQQNGESMPQTLKEELLQSWLFFGLIEDVFSVLDIRVNRLNLVGED